MADDLDLETRQLCPDGACIGVIGPSGHCNVCGKTGDPSLVPPAEATNPGYEPAADADADADWEDSPAEAEAAADGDLDPDIAERELCPDGACIGVIGADGRCKVCGRAAGS